MKEQNEAAIVIDPKEVEQEREDYGAEVYVHEFTVPFEWEGKTYGSLHFNFGRLTGRDALAAERDLKAEGWISVVPHLDTRYKQQIAARACEEKLGTDAFEAMGIRDFNRIMGRVQGFFISAV